MYTLTYIYTSICQIKQSVLLSCVVFFPLNIPHECGVHVTLTLNFNFRETHTYTYPQHACKIL